MAETLEEAAKRAQDELSLAKRHAKQLQELAPEARKRVRECIDRLLGEVEKSA